MIEFKFYHISNTEIMSQGKDHQCLLYHIDKLVTLCQLVEACDIYAGLK